MWRVAQAECRGYGAQRVRRLSNGGQIDEDDVTLECRTHLWVGGDGQRQPRLADASWAPQREQADVLLQEGVANGVQLPAAADQRPGLCWQATIAPGVHIHPRWLGAILRCHTCAGCLDSIPIVVPRHGPRVGHPSHRQGRLNLISGAAYAGNTADWLGLAALAQNFPS